MRRFAGVVLAIVVVALAGCTSSSGSHSGGSSDLNDQSGGGKFAGIGIVPPRARPSFTLTDTSGATVNFGTLTSGHPTLLYFGYTNCPDVCPETMADVGLALKTFPATTQTKVDVVFVSTDVQHDTSTVIAGWLHNFSTGLSANFIGLRGTQAQVDAAQAASHVLLASDGGETHSAELLLFGADNYARVEYLPSSAGEQKQIEHDLPLVLAG